MDKQQGAWSRERGAGSKEQRAGSGGVMEWWSFGIFQVFRRRSSTFAKATADGSSYGGQAGSKFHPSALKKSQAPVMRMTASGIPTAQPSHWMPVSRVMPLPTA